MTLTLVEPECQEETLSFQHHTPPTPADQDPVPEIEAALRLITKEGAPFEIRTLPLDAHAFITEDVTAAARYAAQMSGRSAGIYFTPNPLKGRRGSGARGTARDIDIAERRWLLVDIDPVRGAGASGLSATKSEKAAAQAVCGAIKDWLTGRGFQGVVVSDSGNGYHLLIPVLLPNDNAATRLHRRFLEILGNRFDTGDAHVDRSTANAARIWKVPGTLAAKGETTSERPHRKAELLVAPPNPQAHAESNTEALRAMAADRPSENSRRHCAAAPATGRTSAYASAALEREAAAVASEAPGNRNSRLCKAAFNLGQLVGGGELSRSVVEAVLTEAAHACRLDGAEVAKTIRSGLEAGIMVPRTAPPPKPCGHRVHGIADDIGAGGVGLGDGKPAEAGNGPGAASLGSFPLTDLGNAERFVSLHSEKVRYVHAWGKYLVYDGLRWREDDTGKVDRLIASSVRETLRSSADETDAVRRSAVAGHALKSESAAKLKAIKTLAASVEGVPLRPNELDADPMLLNVENGTVDLRTGELRAHDRGHLITKLCPTPYLPDATAPLFKKFLAAIFPAAGDAAGEQGDADLVAFIQRYLGYCLTGLVNEHAMVVAVGDGANGKSTLLAVAHDVLGSDYAWQAPPELLMTTKNEQHPTILASLFGKRLVMLSETPEAGRLNETRVKTLTGGDKITARRMDEDFWSFDPSHKFIVCTNHLPTIRGTDDGLWRRLRSVPFLARFWDPDKPAAPGDVRRPHLRQDKQLRERLRAEAPGILAWMVRGCLEWQRHGLGMPAAVTVATDNYRTEQDSVGQFVSECCKVGCHDFKVRAGDLYGAYRAYVESAGENDPLGQTDFGLRVNAITGVVRYKNNGTHYRGIALCEAPRNPTEPPSGPAL